MNTEIQVGEGSGEVDGVPVLSYQTIKERMESAERLVAQQAEKIRSIHSELSRKDAIIEELRRDVDKRDAIIAGAMV